MPRSSLWNLLCSSPLSHTCLMPYPSRFSWFDHPNNIWWRIQIIKPLFTWPSAVPSYLVPSRPKCHSQHLFSDTASLCSSLSVTYQVSCPYKTTGKIIAVCVLMFLEGKNSAPNDNKHSLASIRSEFFTNEIVICWGCSDL
jgi:hypothetical protein